MLLATVVVFILLLEFAINALFARALTSVKCVRIVFHMTIPSSKLLSQKMPHLLLSLPSMKMRLHNKLHSHKLIMASKKYLTEEVAVDAEAEAVLGNNLLIKSVCSLVTLWAELLLIKMKLRTPVKILASLVKRDQSGLNKELL
jgi:hypothetical protein